jgi:hypothetical protein
MPLERRQALAKNLERFDKLGREERDALRAVDAQIAAAAPEDRARYLSVLRRYHLWLRTLTAEQREKLAGAPPEQKLEVVTQFLKGQRAVATRPRVVLEVSAMSTMPLAEQANLIKVWLEADAAERKSVTKFSKGQDRIRELQRLAKEKDPEDQFLLGLLQQEVAALRGYFSANEAVAKEHPQLRQNVGRDPRKVAQFLARVLEGKDEPKKGQVFTMRFVDWAFLQTFQIAPVAPKDLDRFFEALPMWLRAGLDKLPPAEAQHRLVVLYRLIYPPGREMPAPPKAEKPEDAKAPPPAAQPLKPAPKKSEVPF